MGLLNRKAAAVNRARELLGVPWVHQGRNPSLGLDCVGLLVECAKAADVAADVPSDYPRVVDPQIIVDHLDQYCISIPYAEMQAGDILLMRWRTVPQHVGLYTGNNYMIHSYQGHGVTYQELIPFWQERVINVYRFI